MAKIREIMYDDMVAKMKELGYEPIERSSDSYVNASGRIVSLDYDTYYVIVREGKGSDPRHPKIAETAGYDAFMQLVI